MCLAIPAKIVEIEGRSAKIDVGGVVREARLNFVRAPKLGDYVLVHAGFAIQKLDEKEARETLKLLSEMIQ